MSETPQDVSVPEDQLPTPGDDGTNAQPLDADYDIELADGSTIAPDIVDDLKSLARDLGLPRDATQKVADLGQKLSHGWMTRLSDTQAEARAAWAQSARTDREFGGDRLDESLAIARSALTRFSSPHLTHMLDVSGLGNHPEVIRAFYRIGMAISEDRFVSAGSGQGSGSGRSAAAKLYPNLPQG